MRCPITYESCGLGDYSSKGLKLLSPRLEALKPFPYDRREAVVLAAEQKAKMSISGAQPKLAAQLSLKNNRFEVTTKSGSFILKPDNPNFMEIPANEAATMHIAGLLGIQTPLSGMVYDKNHELIYFVKRFDRLGKKKLAVEDFGQLLGLARAKKYDANIEDLVRVVREFASFPALEMPKLYELILFNFLVGNEDAHVKNYSLLTDREGVVRLTPAYDLVNTTIPFADDTLQKEEIALPLNGKMHKITREDLGDYLGHKIMELSPKTVLAIRQRMESSMQRATDFVFAKSFLSDSMKLKYLFVLGMRRLRLGHHVSLPEGEHVGTLSLEEQDGVTFARLGVQGMNLVLSPQQGMGKYLDRMVKVTVRAGKTTIRPI